MVLDLELERVIPIAGFELPENSKDKRARSMLWTLGWGVCVRQWSLRSYIECCDSVHVSQRSEVGTFPYEG